MAYDLCRRISGGCWGILEAVLRLTGSSNGAYDAIFWSYSFYVFVGCRSWYFALATELSPSAKRVVGVFALEFLFLLVASGMFSIWAMESWYGIILIVPMIWLGEVFLRQSPLKVIVRPKGSLAMTSVLFILTFVFSIDHWPHSPKTLMARIFSNRKNNVLILSIEGLHYRGYT